ncbi:hypothetical protein [Streptomyces sp. NRRL F-2580]|uniref:hypothetical protein n=1 Tax=Streptomyces sp. NRRL F-2580 TaxID=1463841 RepID=UPI001F252242|nr:hypothetical protein [Streptomyces sp. NRRL F-2580]
MAGLSRRVQEVASAPPRLPARRSPRPRTGRSGASFDNNGSQAGTPASRHAQRLFEAIHALTDAGRPYGATARELGLDRRTVRKYVMRRPPRRPSTLDPHLDYLQQRWDEGEHSAKILHQELAGKGYLGHYQRVEMALAP